MSNKKNFSSADLLDLLLSVGGTIAGTILTLIIFMGNQLPFATFLLVMSGWIASGIGGYRFLKRRNKDLQEEIQQLKGGHAPAQYNLPTSTQQRELPQANPFSAETVPLEVRILDFMAMKKGRITILEAVVYLREPIDKIKPVLEKLQRDGFVRVDVSEAGELVYITDAFQLGV